MDSRRPDNFPERRFRPADTSAERIRRVAPIFLMLLIGTPLESCALWPSAPVAEPQVELVNIGVVDRPGRSPRYRIVVRILNPGDQELTIAGLSCRLKINSLPSVESFTGPLRTLPPGSALRVEMEARTNAIDQLKLTGMLADGIPPGYVLKVHLRREWTLIPLVLIHAGTLPWETGNGS